MPIYEYRCEACGYQFEALQRVGEDGSNLQCPECGHKKVGKQFSAFATSGEARGSNVSSSTCCAGGFS